MQWQHILSLEPQAFTENLTGGLGFRRERCWGYESIFVNTSRKANFEIHLPSKSCCNFTQWFKEGHSWSIVIPSLKSVSKLNANTSSPELYWSTRPNQRPIWKYATVTLTPWKGYLTRSCNLTQLREVRSHASCKTTRTCLPSTFIWQLWTIAGWPLPNWSLIPGLFKDFSRTF